MKTLYLAWRQPDRRWWPVGRLTREGSSYVFTYTRGAISAEQAGFRPLPSFPDREQVYVSNEPFPLFANRLPPKNRPDYEDFVEWLDVPRGETDPMILLARSGGRRATDTFEVFPLPEPSVEGRYASTFFAHGLRHLGVEAEEEARHLAPGEPLVLKAEPENPHDPRALRILTTLRGTHLGFVPRYLCEDVHRLQEAAGEDGVSVRVHRVNLPPTPAQFRLLCALDAPWPVGFHPLSNPDFEPLHSFVPAARH
jgi:hypothetical protein